MHFGVRGQFRPQARVNHRPAESWRRPGPALASAALAVLSVGVSGMPAAFAAGTPGGALQPNVASGREMSQAMSGPAAVAAAERLAGCVDCGSLGRGAKPSTGLAEVVISDPSGGGFAMIMGYTGSRWGLLQAGQDSPYVSRLPGKLLICQAPGNRTNVRSGPSTSARIVAKVARPTKVQAGAFRLARSGTVSSAGRDGEGWYRITLGGRRGWVAARLTYLPGSADGGCAAWLQWPWPDGSPKA